MRGSYKDRHEVERIRRSGAKREKDAERSALRDAYEALNEARAQIGVKPARTPRPYSREE